jgi:hypothetical protein
VINVSLPMRLRLEPLADQPQTAALCYGPFVLAADLGKEGVTDDRINVTDNYFNGVPQYMHPDTPVPTLTGSMDDLHWMHKTEGKLEFTTTATHDGRLLRFIPLYQAIGIRFADYLTFKK